MPAFLAALMPNVVERFDDLAQSTLETLVMVGVSGAFAISLGTILGIVLVVTRLGHLYANAALNSVLGKIVNTIRSIPFVILIALIVSFTRWIVGTSIGIRGAVVPMIIGITPFVARQIEQAIIEVDWGVIEAAKAMGLSRPTIIRSVMLREARPGIVRALTICLINLIGLSAMAGTVGGGGLGDFAIRYGYARYMLDITVVTVIILLVFVNAVQSLGEALVRRISH